MILAAGATLQSGKYVIQAVLYQTDLGMTYQAYHVYLNQKVVLQTLNSSMQRSNFSRVRQQFLKEARQLAKYPSNHRLRAIDLFEEKVEEQDLPFVVLSFFPNQPPQKLGEWFATLPEPPQNGSAAIVAPPQPSQQLPLKETQVKETQVKETQVKETQEPSKQAEVASETKLEEAATKPISSAADKPPAPTTASDSASSTPTPAEIATSSFIAEPSATATISAIDLQAQPQNRNGHSVRVFVQPKPRAAKLIPAGVLNPFLLTALITGAMGAGLGFALRVQPPTPQGKAPFNLGTTLFTREQSFPAQGNWPIHEPPPASAPEPSVSQPTYPTEPALRYIPPVDSFPSSSDAPLPADPAPPAPQTYAPDSASQSSPSRTAPGADYPSYAPPAPAPRSLNREPAQPASPAPLAPAPVTVPPAAVAPAAPAPVAEPSPIAPAPAPTPARPPRPIDQ